MKSKGSPPSSRRPTLRELPALPTPNPAPPSPPLTGTASPVPSPPVTEKFASEPPTKQKNVVASVYQSLLSVFDEMTAEQRMEFVDLASRYSALDRQARVDLLDITSLYASLSPSARATLLEHARSLLRNP